jgi:hypothetical protein
VRVDNTWNWYGKSQNMDINYDCFAACTSVAWINVVLLLDQQPIGEIDLIKLNVGRKDKIRYTSGKSKPTTIVMFVLDVLTVN